MALPNAILYVAQLAPADLFDRMSDDPRLYIFNADELEEEFEYGHIWLIIGQACLLDGVYYLAQRVTSRGADRLSDDTQPVKYD